jgi:hypothetical protein
MTIPDSLRKLPPAWWGAIAGAAVAGATLFPSARLLGGLGAAGLVLYVAHKATAPCCADCAGVEASQQSQMAPQMMQGGMPASEGCVGCDQLGALLS